MWVRFAQRKNGDAAAVFGCGPDVAAGPVRVPVGPAVLDPDASDTILGRGWATAGVTATDVPAEARGVGYLLAEGGQPVRCKAYYLDDDAIHAIAQRGALLRGRRPGPHGLAA
jgi:hypothetical protein